MQDNIVIKDSGQFETIVNEIEKSYVRIKDIFSKEVKNAKEINGTDTWNGNGQVALYNKYVELIKNFSPIEYSLDLYIKFLRKTLEDYRRLEEELENNMQDFASELNVNS